MTPLQEKKNALAAWDENVLTDRQLSVLASMYGDMLETLEALGERGLMMGAVRMRLMSVEQMMQLRRQR